MEHSIRGEVWKFLLGYYDFKSSSKEREIHRKAKVDDYFRMKLQWRSINTDQEDRFSGFRERKTQIEKDVSRTDRTHPFFEGDENKNIELLQDVLMTYVMYNFDLGYVQVRSDIYSRSQHYTVNNKKTHPPVFQHFVFLVYLQNRLSYKKSTYVFLHPFLKRFQLE